MFRLKSVGLEGCTVANDSASFESFPGMLAGSAGGSSRNESGCGKGFEANCEPPHGVGVAEWSAKYSKVKRVDVARISFSRTRRIAFSPDGWAGSMGTAADWGKAERA